MLAICGCVIWQVVLAMALVDMLLSCHQMNISRQRAPSQSTLGYCQPCMAIWHVPRLLAHRPVGCRYEPFWDLSLPLAQPQGKNGSISSWFMLNKTLPASISDCLAAHTGDELLQVQPALSCCA